METGPAMMSSLRGDKSTTILCVDDEQNGLQIRRMVLEGLGYSVLTALDGITALQIFQENEIDLVLLDYAMPGMNGAVVAEMMRDRKPEVPIILLSAYVTFPDEVKRWVDCVMLKAESPAKLFSKIKELVARKSRTKLA